MVRMSLKFLILVASVLISGYLVSSGFFKTGLTKNCDNTLQVSRKTLVINDDNFEFEYDRNSPMIFIGGIPRSGLGLVQSLIETDPDIRCREESIVLPKVLQMQQAWRKSQKESLRLEEAGMSAPVLDSAFSAMILELVAKLGQPSKRICDKEQNIIKFGPYLKQLFPKSKFLYVVRDARATVSSILSRKTEVPGYDLTSPRKCLERWNNDTVIMSEKCHEMGDDACLRIYYEKLVLQPNIWGDKIFKFLDISPGHDIYVSLSRMLDSLNSDHLSSWYDKIPSDVKLGIERSAPMMKKLGYDTRNIKPDYKKMSVE